LFKALSATLTDLPEIELPSKPRMADFALWATAAERGLGLPRFTFMKAYSGNRVEAVRETLDSDLVGASILMFADGFGSEMWEGTCTELRTRLEPFVEESLRKSRVWPQTPRGLSGRLRRLVTFLREAGIVVVFNPKGAKGQRTVTIARTGAH
jgi:hypothetical protein